jgi:hypothetical protein
MMVGKSLSIRNTIRVLPMAALLAWTAFQPPRIEALGQTHPSFTFTPLLPVEMNNTLGLGGIDLLPNGDGVVCTWGGSQKTVGELWIIPNLASGSPGAAYPIAQGLREPLGVKVVGQDIYVMEKPGILHFVGRDSAWTRSSFFKLPTTWYNDLQWHHFSFGLEWRDSAFWFTTGSAYDYDPNDPIQRGALIRVPLNGIDYSQYARGLFNANGLSLGPDQEFFATDNQGFFKPTNVLLHFPTQDIPKDGRFFGHRTNRNNACKTTNALVGQEVCPEDPEYPPAIWIPYGNFSFSPTRPILLKKGPYAGQMLVGDVTRGGLLRFFLERVNGEYQGAVFPVLNGKASGSSDGIVYGIHQFIQTPKGDLISIGIGNGCGLPGAGNWNYNQTCRGMHLFSLRDEVPFEMKAIRATATGFQIEFTKPASLEAGLASGYQVRTTVFTPKLIYGGDALTSDNNVSVAVTEASLSQDGLFAEIKLASMDLRRMYAISLSGITSAQGDSIHSGVGYYTLNQAPKPVGTLAQTPSPLNVIPFSAMLRWDGLTKRISIRADKPFELALKSMDGTTVSQWSGDAPLTVNMTFLKPGIYVLMGEVGGQRHSQRLVLCPQ